MHKTEFQYTDVLDFWFRELTPQDWFGSGNKLDNVIEERYAQLLSDASEGKYKDWEETPRGLLALIIVLDQFPRPIFRGQLQSYATDIEAQRLTLKGIDDQRDKQLNLSEKHFFYMPLMHSEQIGLQKKSIDMYGRLRDEAQMILDFAIDHSNVVHQFGHFPHRNAILGRTNTKEELTFLESEANQFK